MKESEKPRTIFRRNFFSRYASSGLVLQLQHHDEHNHHSYTAIVSSAQLVNKNRQLTTFRLSFTQGLLIGQLSIVFLLGAFIKYFIFGDPYSPDHTAALLATERRSRTLAHKRSLLTIRPPSATRSSQNLGSPNPENERLSRKRSQVLRQPPPLTINAILSKTYYNVHAHLPESLDWFNVLIAQTIAQFRADAQHDGAILTSLSKALNGPSRPPFLDEIKVTELSLGEDFPIFSNCRVIPVDDDGFAIPPRGSGGESRRLQARMDVDLSDFITLAIETKLLLNYPKPLTAILPVALSVSVVRFSGTLSISFIPSSTSPGHSAKTTMAFSFLDDYRLDFSIRSLVGSRSRLQDVPKIASLVEKRLHDWFDERCVEPRFQEIALPSLWPRKKNTRGGEETPEQLAKQAASSMTGSVGRNEAKNVAKEVEKEIRDEARREVEREAEERAAKERPFLRERQGEGKGGEEGIRRRRREDEYVMPGSMPGVPME